MHWRSAWRPSRQSCCHGRELSALRAQQAEGQAQHRPAGNSSAKSSEGSSVNSLSAGLQFKLTRQKIKWTPNEVYMKNRERVLTICAHFHRHQDISVCVISCCTLTVRQTSFKNHTRRHKSGTWMISITEERHSQCFWSSSLSESSKQNQSSF